MGWIPYSGNFKSFTGTTSETGVSDFNSIQLAVRGTLANPSAATADLSSLASMARLDMFDPQRSTTPNEALQFRGFPRATVTATIQFFQIEANQGALDLLLAMNNKVGYPLEITMTCLIGNIDNSTYRKTISQTIPSGDTQTLMIFEWSGTDIFSGVQPYTIDYVTSSYPIYSPSGMTGNVDSTPQDNRAQYEAVVSAQGFSCYIPADFEQFSGAIHYFNGGLTSGTRVENLTGNPIANGTYIEINGTFIYTISGGNGIISAFEFCIED